MQLQNFYDHPTIIVSLAVVLQHYKLAFLKIMHTYHDLYCNLEQSATGYACTLKCFTAITNSKETIA